MDAKRYSPTSKLEADALRIINAVEASEDGIWDWDIINGEFYVSPSFLYLLGLDEEYLPLTAAKLEKLLVKPRNLGDLFAAIAKESGPSILFSLPVQFRHADGTTRFLLLRGKQVGWDHADNPTHCIGVGTQWSRFEKVVCAECRTSNVVAKPMSSASVNLKDTIFLQGKKILLVEDNPINQQVASGMLKRKGLDITIANNGQEALDILHKEGPNAFNLVLMDMEMPLVDGYEATRQLRSEPEFETLPIVALTAHAMREDRERCFSLGMNDHVAKPIKPDLLYTAVEKHIRPSPEEKAHIA